LKENYGRKELVKEKIVKDLFAELKLEEVYKKYEEESYIRINALIQKIDDTVIPKEMFIDFMNRIYKRNK
jgi:farnesyl diphosphate synthase